MPKSLKIFIDKITKSIEEKNTRIIFETEVIPINSKEIEMVHRKDGWQFNWKKEFKQPYRKVYKLIIKGDNIIQGIISLMPVPRQLYIELQLIETAPHNYGKQKQFSGVAANMVAFACKESFESGFNGYVSFTAITKLIEHYKETLGAEIIFSNRMVISTVSAEKLVNSYYSNFFNDRQGKI